MVRIFTYKQTVWIDVSCVSDRIYIITYLIIKYFEAFYHVKQIIKDKTGGVYIKLACSNYICPLVPSRA